jgi:hypothetical protein
MADPNRVFDWLGFAGSVPYYLIPLNLVWSDRGADYDIGHFAQVGARLSEEPDYWRYLFHSNAWREHLVATTCALAIKSREFREDIQCTIVRGSFVGPQLIVALALLHSPSSDKWIESTASSDWHSTQFKNYGAFGVICKRKGLAFKPPAVFRNQLEQDEYSIGHAVAAAHLDFWTPRIAA